MDHDLTLAFYNEHAAELVKTYAGVAPTYLAHLKTLLRRGSSTVLDVGCGTGRDVARLRDDGFNAIGVDASAAMVEAGATRYGLDAKCLRIDALPELKGLSDRFDAVLCAAVLQHVRGTQLLDSLYRLRSLVAPNGFFMISVPLAYPVDDDGRDHHGRLVRIRPAEQYRFFLERLGLREIVAYEETDSLQREGIRWQVLLFGSTGGDELRPIEVVESVLWDDRKVNTYKFALIRAIAHLATHRPNLAQWEGEGHVSVPISAIADKWIGYYWPLMESSAEPAVLQGQQGAKADMAFRLPLTSLVDYWDRQGGYPAFCSSRDANRLPPESAPLLRDVLAKVKTAIQQPIRYAGNDRTGKRMFSYHRGRVFLPAAIWRESALLGRWIEDSVLLRWAEFTRTLSGNRAAQNEATILHRLLGDHEGQRATAIARAAYEAYSEAHTLECAWTGDRIRTFHVDHAIPWALWRNNDLWNLLPVHPRANIEKSARIPSRARVEQQRSRIIRSWEILYEAQSAMFISHARGFIGDPTAKEFTGSVREELFSTFKDVLEYTAVNRGVERW